MGPETGLNEPLLTAIPRHTQGVRIEDLVCDKYHEDEFFAKILAEPSHFVNFEVLEGLVFIKQEGKRLLCIPNVREGGRSVRGFIIQEVHTLLAHLGASKVIPVLRGQVWWKT
ncbi:hypothetical protein K523DRAFT_257658, partial [Schizophyllum commune Tattone D]